jgi:ABC-type lipoprotein release transport system permease subunit
MCIIFIVITGFLTFSFFMDGSILYAAISGVICGVLMIFFIRNIINNAPCLFGRRTDCKKKSG